ncbi:hypothetical protein NQ318_000875 [Aromia moschata]|uniref:Mos1 transposase HTH domain-containing protein n=1 Tax=Aromia moschata TaxID=1265417 RepID=A0AAV8ZGE5_9CUCU|nr:hypothetical protein NQ318_000875 [Aromia moschata]
MLSVQMEQRVNLKFLVKLEKICTEAYVMLKEVYGDECLSRTQVFEWFKRFKEGRETTEDGPSTSKTNENIETIGKLIREDRRLSIRGFAEITGIDKECVRQILHESFNMRKVCAKNSAKNGDILNNINTDLVRPGLLDMVITCDESNNKVQALINEMKFSSNATDFYVFYFRII